MDSIKIVGAGGKRHKNDFYPTPPECTIALIDFLEKHFLLRKKDIIWEPACGNNAMVDVFKKRGYNVHATDIQQGQNYLTGSLACDFDWIITNPPFSLSKEFIEKSIAERKPFALLLKSQYWHSSKRRKLFEEHQPTYVLPLTWRPDFTGEGGSLLDMMWVVWIGYSPITQYFLLEKPDMKGGASDVTKNRNHL